MRKIIKIIVVCFCSIRHIPLFFAFMLKVLKKDKEVLLFKKDIKRFNLSFFYILFERPEYKEILYHRLGFSGYVFRIISGSYPLYINPKTKIMGGITLDHPHHSHINAIRVGKNFQTKHNVTIGNNKGGIPIIGDNVFIGCGACVLGNVRIGNNSKIGANSVVLNDVPDNSIVVGNPAILLYMDNIKKNIPLKDYKG